MLLTVDSHFCSILCCSLWTVFRYCNLPHLPPSAGNEPSGGGRQQRHASDGPM